MTVLLAFVAICGIDTAANWGKIYPGVTISGIDVSGMTVEQAAAAVSEKHSAAFAGNKVIVYADQETADRAAAGEDVFADVQLNEEAMGSSSAWVLDADALQASFDPDASARAALEVGRSDGGLLRRAAVFLSGADIPVSVSFPDGAIEGIASKVDAVAGNPRVECDIEIENGVAYPVDGHDGIMVDRVSFSALISDGLLNPDSAETVIVAKVEPALMRIDRATAQRAADHVNAAIAYGVDFEYGGQIWSASASDCGDWITTEVVERDGAWTLELGVDAALVRSRLMAQVSDAVGSARCAVTFTPGDSGIAVSARAEGKIPMLSQAIDALPRALFSDVEGRSKAPVVAVPQVAVPAEMAFEEACELGVVTKISSYTTEYTDDYPTRNHNIHLMADYLNNSVAHAGKTWSMLETSGEISEAAGYQAASQILDGELVDDFGGGVCQVATTVFNAVYESGFPVPVRHNHSLYMSSYPDGRDAAIAWSYLDLVWKNDSDSDVLVKTSHTATTVTVELWGVDPGYRVESQTGEWSDGAAFKVKVKYDPALSETEVKEEKKGKDGKSITVVRKVYAADGSLMREDAFASTYDPVNRIVSIRGDGKPAVMTQSEFEKLLEKREEERKEAEEKEKAEAQKAEQQGGDAAGSGSSGSASQPQASASS